MQRNITLGTKLSQSKDFYHKILIHTSPRISEDSVSHQYLFVLLTKCLIGIVEKPRMQPRRDYDDYTKFINDTYSSEKEGMLTGTIDVYNRTGGFHSANKKYNPMDTFKTTTHKGSLSMT